MRPYLSYSQLKALLVSPKAYIQYLERKQEPSAAMQLGTAAHTAILEPHLFDTQYTVAPACDRRTTVGKQAWSQFCEQAQGKAVLSEQDFKQIQGFKRNIAENATATALLTQGTIAEQLEEAVMQHPKFGLIKFRLRIDLEGPHFVLDLKTAADASPRGFAWAIRKQHYDLQAVIYSLCKPNKQFKFLAVDSHGAMLYRPSQDTMESGMAKLELALQRYQDCKVLGFGRAYNVDADELEI